jgi:ABC-type nitrate/sulfonate/bicarbonate transport system permease component
MNAAMVLWRFTPVLILALLWEAASRLGLISEFALPALSSVIVSFFHLMADDLWFHTGRSIIRGGIGFAAAVFVGVLAGVLMVWYMPVRMLVHPIMRTFYPMPKSALIPLAIMWIGLGDSSKITLIFIGCLLPIVMSAYNAARGVDTVMLWSARSLGASERDVLWEIVIPAALPEILSGIRISLALSFILMVSGEMIISNDGIGFLIDMLGGGGDYSGMFAGVITISAVGFAADRSYVALTKRLLAWRRD